MKKNNTRTFLISIVFIFISLISCEDEKSENCVNEIIDSKENVLISQDEVETINALNRSPYDIQNNIQIYNIIDNSDNGLRVQCYQFSNDLKVFSNPIDYIYESGVFHHFLGDTIENSIELNTISDFNPNQIVDIYKNHIDKDSYISDDTRASALKNCIDCEFGYWDLNISSGINEMDFVKAWKVNPTDKKYPYAIIGDSEGDIIYYDNGIRY